MRTPRPAAAVPPLALLALLLAGLTGCNPDIDPDETPTPSPVTPFNAHPSAAVPTPTPTWPVRAPDDPAWTENQLAAVRLVDAYEDWAKTAWADPPNADYLTLGQLLGEPLLSPTITSLNYAVTTGKIVPGGVTPVFRTVGEEQLVDGRPEIVVRQCNEDDPGSYVVENGATRPPVGGTRAEYRYVAQWVEEVQGWRIVEITQVNSSC